MKCAFQTIQYSSTAFFIIVAFTFLWTSPLSAQSEGSVSLASARDHLDTIAADDTQRANLVDEQLSVISSAIRANDFDLARDLLVDVTQYFETLFSAEGFEKADRKAQNSVIGKGESEKYFIGDPYEQLFAFMYLGILDMQNGDLDYARASFKGASYADRQSSDEGKDVDCYMAFALEGLANLWLGRQGGADEAFKQARRAFRFRETASIVNHAFKAGFDEMLDSPALTADKSNRKTLKRYKTRQDNLFLVAYENADLSSLLDESPEAAVQNSFKSARLGLIEPGKKSAQSEYIDSFTEKKKMRQAAATGVLDQFEEKVLANISEFDTEEATIQQESFELLLAQLSDPDVNVVVIHERGNGPTKEMGGELGERLEFVLHPYDDRNQTVLITPVGAQTPVESFQPARIESVDYQATTRGGRAIDEILARRAVRTKQVGAAGGFLKGAGFVAALWGDATDNKKLEAIGLATAAVGATIEYAAPIVANTKVDTRCWSELPKEFFISTHTLTPGKYEIRLAKDNRQSPSKASSGYMTTFQVPADGKAFILFSASFQDVAPPVRAIPEKAPPTRLRVAAVQPTERTREPESTSEQPVQSVAATLTEQTPELESASLESVQDATATLTELTREIEPDTVQPLHLAVATPIEQTHEAGTLTVEPVRLAVATPTRDNAGSNYSYINVAYPDHVMATFVIAVAIDGSAPILLGPGEENLVKVVQGQHTVTISDPLPKRRQRPNWSSYDVRLDVGRLEFHSLRLLASEPNGDTVLDIEVGKLGTQPHTLSIPAR